MGVCSAKFWVIAYDDVVLILNEHRIFGQVFADYSIAMKGGKNLHQMMSRIQNLEEWGKERGLKCNASKTVVVIFTKARLKESEYPNKLLVSCEPVEFSNQARYLGVTFDSKLLWTEHFNNQITKCKQYLFISRKVCTKPGDLNPFI